MEWNRYYTSPSTVASFIFGELCYTKPINLTTQLTGINNSYLSYVDRDSKVLSEHVRYSEDISKADFGYKYFLDKEKRQSYFEETLKIINDAQSYIQYIEQHDLLNLDLKKILEMVNKAEPIYNRSMGYYFLSQPEYTAKLNNVFLLNLETYIPKEKVQDAFITLLESEKISCLEDERVDWLSNVIIPILDSDNKNESKINEHILKYQYLPASAQSKPWDNKHFENILHDDIAQGKEKILEELEQIKSKALRIMKKKKQIVDAYELPDILVKNIQVLSELGWLRLEAHLRGWQFFQYFGPVLVEKTAEILSLNKKDVYNLTYKEFINLLEGKISITAEHIARRDGNILIIVTPEKGEEIYFSKKAKEKYESEIMEEISHTSELKGQTVNGNGKIQGEVFVFKWGLEDIEKRIYEFPEGKILVAGQTLPLFMPAIRKAKAIVTNEGGVLCHAAIVSRELNKPAIIGTKFATEVLNDGDTIEMDLDNQKITIIKNLN